MLNGFTAQGRALDKVKCFVLGLLLLCKQFNDKVNVSKQAPTYLETKNINIKRGSPFKCLGKTIQKSGLEKFANEFWCKKWQLSLNKHKIHTTKIPPKNTLSK